jgi:hypothetical protein
LLDVLYFSYLFPVFHAAVQQIRVYFCYPFYLTSLKNRTNVILTKQVGNIL